MTLPDCLRRDGYGEIFVAGHRITLYHLIEAYRDGGSVESLATDFPTLPLPVVQQVIAFWLAHRAQVESYLEEARAEIERQGAMPARGPTLAELIRRQEAKRSSESA